MTTTTYRLHYTDQLAFSCDPIDKQLAMDRTMWVEDTLEHEDSEDMVLLEMLWRRFNRVDGGPLESPLMDELGLRSMCVGDVAELRDERGPRFYICASFGWEPVEGVRSKTIAEL